MSVLFNVDFLDSEQRIFFASMAIFLSRISGDMFPRCDSSHLCNCLLYFERKWTNSRKFPRLLDVCDSSCPQKARPCFDRKSTQSNGPLFPCDSSCLFTELFVHSEVGSWRRIATMPLQRQLMHSAASVLAESTGRIQKFLPVLVTSFNAFKFRTANYSRADWNINS